MIQARGGQTDCWVYDGRKDRYMHAHRLTNVALTFEPIDVDSEGVSTIQRVQVSVKYNYYGLNGGLGNVNKAGQIVGAAAGVSATLGKAQQLLNTVVAGNTLVNALKGMF